MNIYFTTESVNKLQSIILTIKRFYVFDVHEFIKTLDIDPTKPANIYYINGEIESYINNASKLKKYQGIIYVNRNVSEKLYESMKAKFGSSDYIDKFILIDNGNINRHKHLYTIFDEVIFFDRFRKIKIIECNPVNAYGNLPGFSEPSFDF